MPINIQNLIDALNAKVAAVDSSTPLSKITLLNQAASYVNETNNILRYNDPISSVLNVNVSGDSANSTFGDFAFSNVDQKYYFSFGKTFSETLLDDSAAIDQSPRFQGKTVGLLGTFSHSPSPSSSSEFRRIQTFSLASNANAAETNNLYVPSPTNPIAAPQGASNKAGFPNHVSHAYMSGGPNFPSPNPATPSTFFSALIDKFPFSITTELAVNAGELPQDGEDQAAVSSETNGYIAGGRIPPWPGFTQTNQIRQFNFANEGTATNIGTLNTAVRNATGHCDKTDGYVTGGANSPGPTLTSIQKFPLANPTVTTVAGNLSAVSTQAGGISSFTDGYTIGGGTSAGLNMEKFPFASSTAGTVIASLSLVTAINPTATQYTNLAGFSGYDYGYYAGGVIPGTPNQGGATLISRFPYTSESTQSDIGDLVRNAYAAASNQG